MSEKNKVRELTIRALDALALALANHNHKWTSSERKLYEKATKA
jgi:hypothetical protein